MDELAQKILKNIKLAFARDPLIDEYDFLPILEAVNNTNPVRCEEHKLGIEAWAVQSVFLYCYNNLMTWQLANQHKTTRGADVEDVAIWSKIVVMVVADCLTAWNIRKSLVDEGRISMEDELTFSQLVLTKHPKSSETFSHRKWLLSKLLMAKCQMDTLPQQSANLNTNPATSSSQYRSSSSQLNNCHTTSPSSAAIATTCETVTNCQPSTTLPQFNSTLLTPTIHKHLKLVQGSRLESRAELSEKCKQLLEQELCVCNSSALKYTNNYHAWTHRIWIIQHGLDKKIYDQELEKTRHFVLSHVSDHSGYHYRQVALSEVCRLVEVSEYRKLLHTELDLCTEIITAFPGHEAAWYHRRVITMKIAMMCSQSNLCDANPGSAPKKLKADACHTQNIPSLLESEKSFCDSLAEQCKLSGAQGQWQATLAHRHMDTLRRCLCDHKL